MPLKVAFQMDPIGPIDVAADSTFRLALEAQARGHDLFHYTPDRLAYQEGRVTARGWPLTVRPVQGDHATLGPEEERDLAAFDVVSAVHVANALEQEGRPPASGAAPNEIDLGWLETLGLDGRLDAWRELRDHIGDEE